MKRRNYGHLYVLLCGLLCSPVLSLSILKAQSTSITDSIHSLKEVSVNALSSKRSQTLSLNVPLHYLPVTTSSVKAIELEKRGIVNIQDAVLFIPGLRMRTTYGGFQELAIRGFNNSPVMVDGVRDLRTAVNSSAPLSDLSFVESIELIRGSASVLYGHSTVGGILNIVSKSPRPENTINTRLSIGSWDNKQAYMGFGGKIYKSLNYQAGLFYSDNKGYRNNNDKRFSGYLALGYDISKTQYIELRSRFNRDNYGLDMGLAPTMATEIFNEDGSKFLNKGEMLPGLDKRTRYNSESDFLINNATNFTLKYKNQLSDNFKLEDRLAYIYDNIDYQGAEAFEFDKESNDPIYKHYYIKNNAKRYINLDSMRIAKLFRFAYTTKVIDNQLETSGKFSIGNINNNILGGYQVVFMSRDIFRGKAFYGPGVDNPYVSIYNPLNNGAISTPFTSSELMRYITHSLYIQDLIEFNTKLKMLLAGRFDTYSYKFANASIVDGKREYTDRQPYSKTQTSALTYRAGLVYLATSDLSFYGSVANFFMPYRDLYNENTVYINADGNRYYPKDGKDILEPQKGYQTEIGGRYNWSTKVSTSASLFYIYKQNEKKLLGSIEEDGVTKNLVGQIGTSDSKGFEIELNYAPLSNMNLYFGYAYTDARIRKIKKNNYLDQEVDKGRKLAFVPANTFTSYGDYTINKGIFKNLGFNYSISYMDHIYRSVSRDLVYPARTIVNMGASYRMKNNITLSVIVNNVFNESYFEQSQGSRQIVPGTPRNYMTTIAYSLK